MTTDYRICRICLIHEIKVELLPIFNENSEIATNIFLLSGIKITEFTSQQLPALICLQCLNDIKQSYELRKRCIESDMFFKERLKKVEHEVFSNTSQLTIKLEPKDESFVNHDNEDQNSIGSFDISSFPAKTEIFEDYCINENKNYNTRKSTRSTKVKQSKTKSKTKENATCKICQKTFSSAKNMKIHTKAIHEKLDEADMFKCTKCDKSFKMRYQLNRHIKNCHKVEEKEASNVKEVDEDEIFKQKLQGYPCAFCKKLFKFRHSLKVHIAVKHELTDSSKRFLCDICGKHFQVKYYLERHIKSIHLKTYVYKRKKTQSLPCSICGKIMACSSNLSKHEKTHKVLKSEEYWYCDLCGNKFKSRGEMTSHIKRIHLYNISYPCELCPKSYRKFFQLDRHVKLVHQNIKEFKCEWCGKGLSDRIKLLAHVRIHTGEKPFECTWPGCDRKYTHQTDFRRHTWGHTGYRPFKCAVPGCSMGFMKKSELQAHTNRSHS